MRSRPPQPVSRETAPPPLARERKPDLSIREPLQNSSAPATLRSLRLALAGGLAMVLAALAGTAPARGADDSAALLARHSPGGGLVWVAGQEPGFATALAGAEAWRVLVLAAGDEEFEAQARAADEAGLLGVRVFVARAESSDGGGARVPLADQLADAALLAPGQEGRFSEAEILRSLRPLGFALLGDGSRLEKPWPEGYDDWSHPYHGPDNNPQSQDRHARGSLRTQFLGDPAFSPMPAQTVAAGGRLYRAMGHIAHRENQNEQLNTLLGVNAWNGTVLWRRALPEGFMIHRNTMVALPEGLLLGDDVSCKVIDGNTGETLREIVLPEELVDSPVWKWMGEREGVLYALVGNEENLVETMRSMRRGLGHWRWDMWQGHDYADPRLSFGHGRTLAAIDWASGELLWLWRDREFLDARGLAMDGRGRIFVHAPGKHLAAIDAADGTLLWKNESPELLEAIGEPGPAQHYTTGYATSCYLKCDDERLYFAGPQRERLVVVSSDDGEVLWTHEEGNVQLVLREDAVWAAGPQNEVGWRLDHATGEVLEELPGRRACTRATGGVDSVFFRAHGGTVRLMADEGEYGARHIAPMRPPCQDGVLIANGHFYWGPWMCGCQLSLYGHVALAPEGERVDFEAALAEGLELSVERGWPVSREGPKPGDWPQYRGDPERSDASPHALARSFRPLWSAPVGGGTGPATAPVTAAGRVYVANRAGAVLAFDAAEGGLLWKAYTGGPVYEAPALADGRVFAGSGDGRVHAWEASSGAPLWRFRVAPAERRIPVFGSLLSSWPVAGGVVAQGGRVYAAAGFTHYDGTVVVALHAVTGWLLASNTRSGTLSAEVENGISLQGGLRLAEGELRFPGGGVYEWARYDLDTLECLNEPVAQLRSGYRTAYRAYYPEYDKYANLRLLCGEGLLTHEANYEGLYFHNLSLREPLPAGAEAEMDAAGEYIRMQLSGRSRAPERSEALWEDPLDRRFTAFIVGTGTGLDGASLLGAGHYDERPEEAFLVLIDVETGEDLWSQPLPALTVQGGLARDAAGRIFAVLENGELHCWAPEE